MATIEALYYGLARRYRPFMVNYVTGFIGSQTRSLPWRPLLNLIVRAW